MKKTLKKRHTKPPQVLSFTDRAMLIGIPLLLFGSMALVFHFAGVNRQTKRITRTVNEWARRYHLNEDQTKRIIEIELEHHGSGSPFAIQKGHGPSLKHHHHEEISQVMSPEDGMNFMRTMEKDSNPH